MSHNVIIAFTKAQLRLSLVDRVEHRGSDISEPASASNSSI